MSKKVGIKVVNPMSSFKRFRLYNEKGEFWTGEEWDYEEEKAMTYESVQEAGAKSNELFEKSYKHKKRKKYKASITVEVISDEDIPFDEVIDFLMKSTEFTFDYDKHGTGPRKGSLIQATLNWQNTKRIK